MADSTQSDADKIRAKRLAKLGGPASSSTTTPPAPAAENEQPAPATAPQASDATAESDPAIASQRASYFAQMPAKAPEPKSTTPQITVKPAPRPASPAKRERDGSEKAQSRTVSRSERPPESIEKWQDRNLRQIYRVTLKPEEVTDGHGNKLIFLSNTKEELEEADSPLMLDVNGSDGILSEAAGQAPGGKVFEYFLQCFKRVSRAIRGSKYDGPDDPKHGILKEARRFCMSYCIFAVTMPDMFENNASTSNPLVAHLKADPECEVGICTDFLNEATSRFEEDDSIKEAVVGAAEELSRQLAKQDMLGDYQNYVRGLRNLLRYPKIVDAVTESPLWAPGDVAAQEIETKTILGPFFRISPAQQDVANSYFSAPRTRDSGFVRNGQNAIRMTLRTHQLELFEITNSIVKSGPVSRGRILDWLAICVNKNHKKRAMRPDPRIISTDGFMINVTNVLDQLCDPFMDARFGKIEKIDVAYLRRNPRVDISDETKINADQKAADEFYADKVDGTNNFISEVFFLTVAAHHYGTEAAQEQIGPMRKTIKRGEEELKAMEAERHKYVNDPRYLAKYEESLQRYKNHLDNMASRIHATEGILLDDLNQARSMQFMRYVIVWLLRLATGQNLPTAQLQLPLPETQADVFRFLPEYFLEDIVDNFKFITRHMPNIITPQQSEELVQVCITFLRSTEYVKNPGVKSGLVTILFTGVYPWGHNRRGILGDQLIGSSFAHKHLLHALMKFYIEAENTGTHTQFYDKFNIRFEIFQVIKCIWVNTIYRENLAKEARVNTEFFVRFVNMIVNDVNFVLDESLGSLRKINELTKELADPVHMQGLSEEQRKEKQELLDDQKGKARSYMGLTTESMETLVLFTETLPDSFTAKEIVTRLVDMLDYNLMTLVGPKSKDLKVDNMQEEYKFNPRQLLSDFITVYVNLGEKQNFIEAIADDDRSYKPEHFDKAANIMKDKAMKSPEELRAWERLGKKIAEVKQAKADEEEDLGEIPEEFLDPLIGDLLTDPVYLPTSRTTVNRSTIRQQLLNVPEDPFNRMHLTMDQVVAVPEVLEKIEKWKAERRAEKAEKMDTT
ncbi:Ubiquitin conjugation factor E4 [Fulvia fulva]|nr:Ubiquitin conjugation factor E4 [Fulvia fulva]KAK4611142.1 Ubiquitin conjugation factor E4 [Fulvia fulva]WPV21759.1 Ubiquitin conjugation factor E4 [Fulvia fulva]WPV37072.1 Ubiquitin conjugation factor E4 [Fulvia fulva]